MTRNAAQKEQISADAADWLARLQRDAVTEADAEAFDAWLSQSPDHEAAYGEALAVWHAYDASADQVLAEMDRLGRVQRLKQTGTRRWMIGAGGLAAAAALAVAVAPALLPGADVTTYATGKGEHRRVELADGSAVDLNAETRMTVSLSRKARQVEMIDGEAIFDVAHDTARPFTVATSSRVVRVVGTQFDVRNRQGDLTVTVARGKVQVRPADAATAGRAFVLTPGQRLDVASNGAEQLAQVDPQEAFSWRAGRLVYREAPLGDVVADLNRQYVQPIEITDPELAKMPITGVIVLDDQAAVIARLTLMLPVRSVPSERGLLLLRK